MRYRRQRIRRDSSYLKLWPKRVSLSPPGLSGSGQCAEPHLPCRKVNGLMTIEEPAVAMAYYRVGPDRPLTSQRELPTSERERAQLLELARDWLSAGRHPPP